MIVQARGKLFDSVILAVAGVQATQTFPDLSEGDGREEKVRHVLGEMPCNQASFGLVLAISLPAFVSSTNFTERCVLPNHRAFGAAPSQL